MSASVAMGWPSPLRRFIRVLIGSAPTAVFAALMTLARAIMLASTWPSRSYLLAIAAKLAFAWLVILLITSVIRNTFIVRAGVAVGMADRGAEHHRPA